MHSGSAEVRPPLERGLACSAGCIPSARQAPPNCRPPHLPFPQHVSAAGKISIWSRRAHFYSAVRRFAYLAAIIAFLMQHQNGAERAAYIQIIPVRAGSAENVMWEWCFYVHTSTEIDVYLSSTIAADTAENHQHMDLCVIADFADADARRSFQHTHLHS